MNRLNFLLLSCSQALMRIDHLTGLHGFLLLDTIKNMNSLTPSQIKKFNVTVQLDALLNDLGLIST